MEKKKIKNIVQTETRDCRNCGRVIERVRDYAVFFLYTLYSEYQSINFSAS